MNKLAVFFQLIINIIFRDDKCVNGSSQITLVLQYNVPLLQVLNILWVIQFNVPLEKVPYILLRVLQFKVLPGADFSFTPGSQFNILSMFSLEQVPRLLKVLQFNVFLEQVPRLLWVLQLNVPLEQVHRLIWVLQFNVPLENVPRLLWVLQFNVHSQSRFLDYYGFYSLIFTLEQVLRLIQVLQFNSTEQVPRLLRVLQFNFPLLLVLNILWVIQFNVPLEKVPYIYYSGFCSLKFSLEQISSLLRVHSLILI